MRGASGPGGGDRLPIFWGCGGGGGVEETFTVPGIDVAAEESAPRLIQVLVQASGPGLGDLAEGPRAGSVVASVDQAEGRRRGAEGSAGVLDGVHQGSQLQAARDLGPRDGLAGDSGELQAGLQRLELLKLGREGAIHSDRLLQRREGRGVFEGLEDLVDCGPGAFEVGDRQRHQGGVEAGDDGGVALIADLEALDLGSVGWGVGGVRPPDGQLGRGRDQVDPGWNLGGIRSASRGGAHAWGTRRPRRAGSPSEPGQGCGV